MCARACVLKVGGASAGPVRARCSTHLLTAASRPGAAVRPRPRSGLPQQQHAALSRGSLTLHHATTLSILPTGRAAASGMDRRGGGRSPVTSGSGGGGVKRAVGSSTCHPRGVPAAQRACITVAGGGARCTTHMYSTPPATARAAPPAAPSRGERSAARRGRYGGELPSFYLNRLVCNSVVREERAHVRVSSSDVEHNITTVYIY